MSHPVRRLAIALTAAALLPFIAAAGASKATAQVAPLDERIAQAQSLIRAGTRQVLEEELLLTDDEKADFWTLYDEYDAEREKIGERYIKLVGAYMRRYEAGTLTDDDADVLLDAYFDIEMDTLQLEQRYLRKFRKIMPGIKVARFYQLENKIRVEVDAALALAIPLADPR